MCPLIYMFVTSLMLLPNVMFLRIKAVVEELRCTTSCEGLVLGIPISWVLLTVGPVYVLEGKRHSGA